MILKKKQKLEIGFGGAERGGSVRSIEMQEDYLENPLKITPTYSVLFTIK